MSELVGIWADIHLAEKDATRWWSARVQGSAWKDWTGLLEDAGAPPPRRGAILPRRTGAVPLYRDCQKEMARREAAIEVKRRETWEAFERVRVVIFQRGTAWWARRLVSYGKGSEQWQLGAAATERDARRTAVEGEAPALFAEQLGKRLLFDGEPPGEGWFSPGPLRTFAPKVEAILKRRGL